MGLKIDQTLPGLVRIFHLFRRSSRPCIPLVISLVLAACQTAPTQPDSAAQQEVDQRVRAPASQDSEGVQVFPLRNPAVEELVGEASGAEASGDFDLAANLLERALRIQPRNPEVLQQMAEVQLQRRDYQQAMTFATRSYDIGPRVGEICSRNWRTISVAKEYMGDSGGSIDAESKAKACMNTRPKRL